jgi:hypothetical protein
MKTLLAALAVALALGGSASAASDQVGKLIAEQANIASRLAAEHCNLTRYQKAAIFKKNLGNI